MAETDSLSLPPTHVFITLAHRRRLKTFALPRWFVATIAVGAGAASLWMVASTVYVAGHDSLLASLMDRERDAQYGYEDRIASLQRELDRSLSQHARLERTVAAKLDTLTAQEADLRRNAGVVARLAQEFLRAPARLGVAAAMPSPTPAATPTPARSAESERGDGEPQVKRLGARMTALMETFGALASAQTTSLTTLQAAAEGKLARYRMAFVDVGLSASRFGKAGQASGGPFVPLDASRFSPFERASWSAKATLAEAERLGDVISRIPFGKPLPGSPEVTSPYGARIDPFLGRPALHTGVDLRDDLGTAVRATAPGRITVAGAASGYGEMVEIDHGNGLTTRYGHLSAIAVTVGETVAANEIVGEVGATGRATGPHLHYETRIDGETVDPMRFLTAGERLFADAVPAR